MQLEMPNLRQISDNSYAAPAMPDWLRAQACLDWHAAGLPDFEQWDQALVSLAYLMAHSHSPMALMLGTEGVLFANESAQHLFTGDEGACNARSVLEVVPQHVLLFSSALSRVMRGESFSVQEQPLNVQRQGRMHKQWLHFDFMPVLGSDGRTVAALCIPFDVTDMVLRIRQLTDSEQGLRYALEGSGLVGTWFVDLATQISKADANVARMYGLSEDDCKRGIPVSRFHDAIHPEDRERVAAAIVQSVETSSAYRCRYRVVDLGGQIRWVVSSGRPSRSDDEEAAQFRGVVVEVTEQMETASALAASRFHFETLTEALPQIVWSCNETGQHDYFSRRWSEFTGINPQDADEHTWKTLVFPEHWDRVWTTWQNALHTGGAYDIDYRFRHFSGEYRWLRVMALPIRDEEGRIVRWFGTSTDIHEAYKATEERERLAHELERIAAEDQLTSVLTRRAFFAQSEQLISAAQGHRKHLSLLMLDIDHFKVVNDTYGHVVGDRVLAASAEKIQAAVRAPDLVGRLGGEEFAVLLPGCSKSEAIKVAERIRSFVEDNQIQMEDGRIIAATVSVGVATTLKKTDVINHLLSSADMALYKAKSSGRNRVCIFDEACKS
ncbi:diguanylate cyclase [Comamonas odontotermitis]|uniref:sensor domain-containing diguanylate cyclase n=1 Tax=Comamonas odontotermitis TaxID=379895 RepID=UPI0037500351